MYIHVLWCDFDGYEQQWYNLLYISFFLTLFVNIILFYASFYLDYWYWWIIRYMFFCFVHRTKRKTQKSGKCYKLRDFLSNIFWFSFPHYWFASIECDEFFWLNTMWNFVLPSLLPLPLLSPLINYFVLKVIIHHLLLFHKIAI